MITIFNNHLKILNDRLGEIGDYICLIDKQMDVAIEIKESQDQTLIKTNEYVNMLIKLKNTTVNYNAIIISLYGCYENFIDNDILKEYLKAIIKLDYRYYNLDKKIQGKYLKEATDFLSNPQRFVNYGLEVGDIIEGLYKCYQKDDCNEINIDLILKHPANLKIEQINNLLCDVGIMNASNFVKNSEKYIKYYMDEKNITDLETAKNLLSSESNELTFSILTDLVERRNSVSHRWNNNDDRLGINIIKSTHMKYIEVLCECIYELICLKYMEEIHKKGRMKKFDNIITVHNNNILCLNSEKARLKIGDHLFIKNHGQAYISEILDMEIDKESIKQMIDNTNVGLKLSTRVKVEYEFYYIL